MSTTSDAMPSFKNFGAVIKLHINDNAPRRIPIYRLHRDCDIHRASKSNLKDFEVSEGQNDRNLIDGMCFEKLRSYAIQYSGMNSNKEEEDHFDVHIMYKDNEGDEIEMSSDEELTDAILEFSVFVRRGKGEDVKPGTTLFHTYATVKRKRTNLLNEDDDTYKAKSILDAMEAIVSFISDSVESLKHELPRRHKNDHDPEPTKAEIPEPSTSPTTEMPESSPTTVEIPKSSPSTPTAEKPPPTSNDLENERTDPSFDPNFTHVRYQCDGCGTQPIVGYRYHAMDVADLDLCKKCRENCSMDGVSFLQAQDGVGEVPSETQGYDPNFVHSRHECDGCGMTPIVGYRWHATNIPNYDLCHKCKRSCAATDVYFKLAQFKSDSSFKFNERHHRSLFQRPRNSHCHQPPHRSHGPAPAPHLMAPDALEHAIQQSLVELHNKKNPQALHTLCEDDTVIVDLPHNTEDEGNLKSEEKVMQDQDAVNHECGEYLQEGLQPLAAERDEVETASLEKSAPVNEVLLPTKQQPDQDHAPSSSEIPSSHLEASCLTENSVSDKVSSQGTSSQLSTSQQESIDSENTDKNTASSANERGEQSKSTNANANENAMENSSALSVPDSSVCEKICNDLSLSANEEGGRQLISSGLISDAQTSEHLVTMEGTSIISSQNTSDSSVYNTSTENQGTAEGGITILSSRNTPESSMHDNYLSASNDLSSSSNGAILISPQHSSENHADPNHSSSTNYVTAGSTSIPLSQNSPESLLENSSLSANPPITVEGTSILLSENSKERSLDDVNESTNNYVITGDTVSANSPDSSTDYLSSVIRHPIIAERTSSLFTQKSSGSSFDEVNLSTHNTENNSLLSQNQQSFISEKSYEDVSMESANEEVSNQEINDEVASSASVVDVPSDDEAQVLVDNEDVIGDDDSSHEGSENLTDYYTESDSSYADMGADEANASQGSEEQKDESSSEDDWSMVDDESPHEALGSSLFRQGLDDSA